jgi:hypothetical protein
MTWECRPLRRVCFPAASAFLLLLSLAALSVFAARILERALEREVIFRTFDEALPLASDQQAQVTWAEPDHALDRSFRQGDADRAGRALTEAWRVHAAALATGIHDALADHFSGAALARATSSAAETGARMAVLRQSARPVFFHSDGSLLQIEADALTVRYLLDDDESLAAYRLTRDAVVTTLQSESSGWRVFSHERRAVQELPVSPPPRMVPRLAGINYYPAEAQWTRFWPDLNPGAVEADFARIRELGGNAVRVFLQSEPFTGSATSAKALADLGQLLQLAEANSLYVVPTLFDLKQSYVPTLWAADAEFLDVVLPVLAGSPSVAYIDIKNEPDLDFVRAGQGTVEAWLRTMLALVRQGAPAVPVTIGWSTPEVTSLLAAELDLLSYHDYGDLNGTAARFDEVRRMAPGRPVHVTEVGETSWQLAPVIGPSSSARQAERLGRRLAALRAADGVFVWTLHDFPEPDRAAVGRSPWVRGLQSRFGLIDDGGAEKPAATTVRDGFSLFLTGDRQ